MDQQQYARLMQRPKTQPVLQVADLHNQEPRSLMHGYTAEGNSFHVYLDEDGELHVLTYKAVRFPETATRTQLKYMVVKHTHGPDGGVSSNQDFVPSKQAFPESCDFEFCVALKLRGIDVPFRAYAAPYCTDETKSSRRWVAERFDATQGASAVEICGSLFRRERGLTRQPIEVTIGLVHEAVKSLQVPFAPAKQHYESMGAEKEVGLAHIYVREQDAAAVEAKVLEFWSEFTPSVSDAALAEELVELLFSFGEYESLETMHQAGGEVLIRVGYESGRMVTRDTAVLVHYRGPKFGYCEKAATGVYHGRPFIATFHDTVTNILFSQFGAREGFVERYLTQYGLEPAADMK